MALLRKKVAKGGLKDIHCSHVGRERSITSVQNLTSIGKYIQESVRDGMDHHPQTTCGMDQQENLEQ